MLRIVFDARSVLAKKSGIGNYMDALLRHLVPEAHDVQFTVLRHPSTTEPIVRHPRVRELRFAGETKSVATVFRLGRAHSFRDHDLYHSPADLVPLGLECPWVVTMHDLMWLEAPELASAFLPVRLGNSLWYRANWRHSVRGARRVISISHATARALARRYPVSADKISVIHHGIEHARYAAAAGAPRERIDKWVRREQRYSLIVGQGSPYKNHARMIRAFIRATADAPEHVLVLVRRFSRIDREMKALLERPEVKQKIVALPFVSDEELLSLYRHATMLLFASLYEGFGLPALEAMCMGTPVLGSTAEAVAEVTSDAALLADPWSNEDLVAKIRLRDRDEVLRARLRLAGPERARQFTWQKAAKETLDAYRCALASS